MGCVRRSLQRHYRPLPMSRERPHTMRILIVSDIHANWHALQAIDQPFDVCLCLHEDWEAAGFYVYELNPDRQPSYAEAITQRVSEVCPIDMSPMIEERPAVNGIIAPNVDPRSRPQWPEAFYLFTHKTRLSYTMEAPSDFPLPVRVAALVAGVHAAVEAITAGPPG